MRRDILAFNSSILESSGSPSELGKGRQDLSRPQLLTGSKAHAENQVGLAPPRGKRLGEKGSILYNIW
jgi:hypothetical protein